jgi:glutathione S-transferase
MLVKLELKVKYVWYTDKAQFKTQEYLAINPKGLVPTLVTDQGILQDSGVIMRYLAEQDTKYDLAGRNLWEKAQVDQWCDYVGSLTMTFLKPWSGAIGKFTFTEKERKEMYAEFPKALGAAETHFKTNKFFCGDH